MATTKPFHESIVDVLSTCTPGQLGGLLPLIWQTKIPTNHDKIISAMEKAFAHYDSGPAGHDPSMKLYLNKVIDSVRQQEREAEVEAAEMAKRDEAMLREQVRREERLIIEDALDR